MADEKPSVLAIPVFHASGVHIKSNGNEVMFVFTRLAPTLDKGADMEPTVAVTVPRGSAADLRQVLTTVLDTLETDFGTIDTPFLRDRRKDKK